jgi:putative tricarboxylic transport membrane protein
MSRDLVSALFWLAIAIFVSFEGFTKLQLGTLRQPGPGFFPFWAGLFLGAFALILLVRSLKSREPLALGALPWRTLIVVLTAILGYLLFLETLGFVVVTFLFLLVLFCFAEIGWIKQTAWSTIATSLVYVLFKFWLKVQLPQGPFGI